MKELNVNDTIKVKLTPFGEEIYNHKYDELNKWLTLKGLEPVGVTPIKKDDSGFVEFQLWDFMKTFGEHFRMGEKLVIEKNTIYFNSNIEVDA